MKTHAILGTGMPPAFRLGLATRGNTQPAAEDVLFALDRGVNYWNWCGHEDGMSQAVRELGSRRAEVILATQIGVEDWSRDAMCREIDAALSRLATDWLDVVTLYYVESEAEWNQILAPKGALRALQDARDAGVIRAIGLTTHQRPLAAQWVETQLLDVLMVRYNAAHRGAEREIFPRTDQLGLPVVCFTCLRWGALLKPTRHDPPGTRLPNAADCYRFVLSHPSVSVALMAPDDRNELLENLRLLDDWRPLRPDERQRLTAHGNRVRETAGPFP